MKLDAAQRSSSELAELWSQEHGFSSSQRNIELGRWRRQTAESEQTRACTLHREERRCPFGAEPIAKEESPSITITLRAPKG